MTNAGARAFFFWNSLFSLEKHEPDGFVCPHLVAGQKLGVVFKQLLELVLGVVALLVHGSEVVTIYQVDSIWHFLEALSGHKSWVD